MQTHGSISICLFAAVLLAGITAACASATVLPTRREFFVSPTGTDSSPGTEARPWATIQKAANTVSPGDIVTVLAGDYGDQRVQVTRPGAPDSPITFQARGAVTMKGFTVMADYIAISGFDITNTDDDDIQGWGIYVHASYCDLENNHIYYATRGGIELDAPPSNPTATTHCLVKNNRLERNSQLGIDLMGREHVIEGNEIWGSLQYHPRWVNPPAWADADGLRFFGKGHIIRSNFIHDLHYGIPENRNPHMDCFQTWADGYHEAAQDTILERNRCSNSEAQAPNEVGQGFMLQDAGNLVIRNNIVEAFRGVNASSGDHRLTIANNVFVGELDSNLAYYPQGISLAAPDRVTIENNVFYNLPGHVIWLAEGDPPTGLSIGHNLAYRNDGKPLWDAPSLTDLWGMDPRFVDPGAGNYHLRVDSPAIDKGSAISAVTDDRDGVIRPQGSAYDIGAYEFVP